MALSLFTTASFAADKTYTMADVTSTKVVKINGRYAENWLSGAYIEFSDVDFTGAKSIRMMAYDHYFLNRNGEAFAVYIDDPLAGECLGYILMNHETQEPREWGMNLKKEISGKHKLYIKQNYSGTDTIHVESVTISGTEYNDPDKVTPVPDEKITDKYSDTWTAVSQVGMKVADFEETGPVKEGTRDVLMFYHDWHIGTSEAQIFSETIAKYPEAKDDYNHEAWHSSPIWWSEPVYGFYDDLDYWHYRKSAELMADAGVDAVFCDYTNWSSAYANRLAVMLRAYHDAREDGVDVPKISYYGQMYSNAQLNFELLAAYYFNACENGYYDDLLYYVDGKPFVIMNGLSGIGKSVTNGDKEKEALAAKMVEYFNYRSTGSRRDGVGWSKDGSTKEGYWHWLTPYPQPTWGKTREDGRAEMICLGMACNFSYVDGWTSSADWTAFSDPFTMGKTYSQGFGDDYRPEALHEGYFFREQASRVLDEDPWYVMVDGWNEYTTARSKDLFDGKFPNAMIDMMDDNRSRDMEPSKGILKDDYYLMLVDFVRKYKGTRPAPVASDPVTIDINGDAAQWAAVGPEYINDFGGYERDADGYMIYNGNGERYHYTTEVINYILKSKVARDNDNYYFYAECGKDIQMKDSDSMNLYINSDRNPATGWEGYDLLVSGNKVSRFSDGAYTLTDAGTAEFKVTGKIIQVKVPKSIIGDSAEIEFKWTDNIKTNGDLMLFYTEGNAAPVGRFNYLYTIINQTALTADERMELSGTSIFKAGSKKMIVSGGKMNVYDKDTRVTPFEANGTLYIPLKAVEDVLAYGRSKAYYDSAKNRIYVQCFDLADKEKPAGIEMEIKNEQWFCNTLGSSELFVDGKLTYTTAATAIDGVIYIPLTMLADGLGADVQSLGGGVYAISKTTANVETAKTVLSHLM